MNKKNLMAYAFVLMSAAHLAHGSEDGTNVEPCGKMQRCKELVSNWAPRVVGSWVVYNALPVCTGGVVDTAVSGAVKVVKTGATKMAGDRGLPDKLDGVDGNGGLFGLLGKWGPTAAYAYMAYQGGSVLARLWKVSSHEPRAVALTEEDRVAIVAGVTDERVVAAAEKAGFVRNGEDGEALMRRNDCAKFVEDGDGDQKLVRVGALPKPMTREEAERAGFVMQGEDGEEVARMKNLKGTGAASIADHVVDGWLAARKVVSEERLTGALQELAGADDTAIVRRACLRKFAGEGPTALVRKGEGAEEVVISRVMKAAIDDNEVKDGNPVVRDQAMKAALHKSRQGLATEAWVAEQGFAQDGAEGEALVRRKDTVGLATQQWIAEQKFATQRSVADAQFVKKEELKAAKSGESVKWK